MGNGLSEPHAIFPCLPSFQALHIVILGLDCAGKTTVLYRLRFNEFVNTVPTKGFNTEKIKITRLQENQGVPVLVVANKQDLRSALPLCEVEQMLALNELGSHTPWHLQPACAIIGEGLQEGLERLHSMIIKRRKMMRQQKRKR
ncbi:hypothetical protein PO909_004804 [Leuciscus waleckii]